MQKNLHFDINPHVVKQLGEELVSDEITALMELVKNAYDADASYVYIEIDTVNSYSKDELFYPNHTGFIIVDDDGDGMNLDIIENSWLIISGSKKRDFKAIKKKTTKGRAPLGDKGLGRLSTQRLADYCEIITGQNANKNQIHVAFNWKDFENNVKLSDVPIQIKDSETKKKGTKLILSNVKDKEVWKGNNLESFKGLISQMISPYQENKPFEIYLKVNGQDIDLLEENIALRDIALSRFSFVLFENKLSVEGKIRTEKLIGKKPEEYFQYISQDRGKKFLSFLNGKGKDFNLEPINEGKFFLSFKKEFQLYPDIPRLEILDGKIAHPGNFKGEINEFSFDRWMKDDTQLNSAFDSLSNYRSFAEQQVGIKLYRNGFAVKPFGFANNDWLKLSEAQTKATSYYYLRPANIIGYFAIDEYENEFLKDKTDREGLVSNPYSRNFEIIAFHVRDECNRFLDFVRRNYNTFLGTYQQQNFKLHTTTQAINLIGHQVNLTKNKKDNIINASKEVSTTRKLLKDEADKVKSSGMFSSDDEKKYAAQFNAIYEQLENAESTLNEIMPIVEQVENFDQAVVILKSKLEFFEEQLSYFSELAGLGLTSEMVSHEFKNISDQLAERSNFYSKKLEAGKLTNSDLYVLFEFINSTIKGLRVQLKHLDPALKYVRDKKETFSAFDFFEQQADYYKNRFNKKEIRFELKVIEDFRIEMSKGVFTQITDNIIINSEYWLEDRKRMEPKFSPKITIEIQKPWIEIFDNGNGVSPSVSESLFEPFVTMKPKSKGRGLGLFIVQQLLDSVGGVISLSPELNNHKRRYKFSINLSNVIK